MIKKEKSWASKRISAINRKIARALNKNAMTENYIEEHQFICNSDAKNKKEYNSSAWSTSKNWKTISGTITHKEKRIDRKGYKQVKRTDIY